MNKVEHTVTKVLSKPYYNFMWCVDVVANSWGREEKTTVMLRQKEDANKVCPGYKFEA